MKKIITSFVICAMLLSSFQSIAQEKQSSTTLSPSTKLSPSTTLLAGVKPDLIVESIVLSASNGTPEQPTGDIKVTIKNIGTKTALGTSENSASGYMVDLILSMDQAAPVQYAVVPNPYTFGEDMLLVGGRISNTNSLKPGQSHTYTQVNCKLPSGMQNPCGIGFIYVGAVVDSGKKVTELSEKNNTKFVPFKLDCTGKPDLMIRSIEVMNGYVKQGQGIGELKVTIYNKGTAPAKGTNEDPANGYMIDLLLSMDNNIPAQYATLPNPYNYAEDGLLQGGRLSNTVTLAVQETYTYTVNYLIMPNNMQNPCGTGKINIGAMADPGLRVAESNEGNNTFVKSFSLICQ